MIRSGEIEDVVVDFVIPVVLCGVIAFVFCGIGCIYEYERQQREAIDAGVAEWTVDPKTGKTEFRYLKPAVR